eukprot:1160714-Pelagomonas_calceolata.AAC.29
MLDDHVSPAANQPESRAVAQTPCNPLVGWSRGPGIEANSFQGQVLKTPALTPLRPRMGYPHSCGDALAALPTQFSLNTGP